MAITKKKKRITVYFGVKNGGVWLQRADKSELQGTGKRTLAIPAKYVREYEEKATEWDKWMADFLPRFENIVEKIRARIRKNYFKTYRQAKNGSKAGSKRKKKSVPKSTPKRSGKKHSKKNKKHGKKK
jgi:hypothetical protein